MARYHLIDDTPARLYDPAACGYVDNCRILYVAACDDDDCTRDHLNVLSDDDLDAAHDQHHYDVYGTIYPTVPYGSARQHDSPAY